MIGLIPADEGMKTLKNDVILVHNNHAPNRASNFDFQYPISDKNMRLPIPFTEFAGNTKLTPDDQNPGY